MLRGEIRWYRFAGPDKTRLILILTRDSILDLLGEVTIAPITSTIRDIPSEVPLTEEDGMPQSCAVNLDHVQTVPKANSTRRPLPDGRLLASKSDDQTVRLWSCETWETIAVIPEPSAETWISALSPEAQEGPWRVFARAWCSLIPGILWKWRRFPVTTFKPWQIAVAAICRSGSARRCPRCDRPASISP